MEKIYDSQYLTLAYDQARRCIYVTWKPASQRMEASDYRQEMEHYFECIRQFKPIRYMNDMREFYFTITPDLQEWFGNQLGQLYADPALLEGSLSAIVMSKDFFSHVSVEQAIDEVSLEGNNERVRYFDTIEAAEKWLGIG